MMMTKTMMVSSGRGDVITPNLYKLCVHQQHFVRGPLHFVRSVFSPCSGAFAYSELV